MGAASRSGLPPSGTNTCSPKSRATREGWQKGLRLYLSPSTPSLAALGPFLSVSSYVPRATGDFSPTGGGGGYAVDSRILCKVMAMSQSLQPAEANLGPERWRGSPRALSQATAGVGSRPRSVACHPELVALRP